jgi:hypothetical protein
LVDTVTSGDAVTMRDASSVSPRGHIVQHEAESPAASTFPATA